MTTFDLQDALPAGDMNVAASDEQGNYYQVVSAEVVKQDGKKAFILTLQKI